MLWLLQQQVLYLILDYRVVHLQDNNNRQDYKLKVGLPVGTTLDSWAEATAETLRKQVGAAANDRVQDGDTGQRCDPVDTQCILYWQRNSFDEVVHSRHGSNCLHT